MLLTSRARVIALRAIPNGGWRMGARRRLIATVQFWFLSRFILRVISQYCCYNPLCVSLFRETAPSRKVLLFQNTSNASSVNFSKIFFRLAVSSQLFFIER